MRSYAFQWAASPRATHYEFQEDADGAGPLAATKLADALTSAQYTISDIPLHLRVNAVYSVRACNASGCSAPATIVPNVAEAAGYFKAANAGEGDQFGAAVALSADGSTLAIGAPGEASHTNFFTADPTNDDAPGAGAVYVFSRGPDGWKQHAYLKGETGERGERFGTAVALNADGTRLAIGAPGWRGIGAVMVWERGGDNIWWQGTWLTGSTAGDAFGSSVALSADALTLVIGAPGENASAGGVQVWLRVGASVWQLMTHWHGLVPGDRFGAAVASAADASTIFVGAPGESTGTSVGVALQAGEIQQASAGSGVVYVYSGNVRRAVLKSQTVSAGAGFGSSLSASQDGRVLGVGAPRDPIPSTPLGNGMSIEHLLQGGAYVFEGTGSSWTQQAVLRGDVDNSFDQLFGASVSISSDGKLLAVGAPDDPASGRTGLRRGAISVLQRDGASWNVSAHLQPWLAPDAPSNAYMRFGQAVALGASGKTLAVGAPGEFSVFTGVHTENDLPFPSGRSAPDAGAVYLY